MAVTLFYPYCTLEEVQRFMGDTNPDHVDAILSAINRASRYIDDKSRWLFYRKEYTDEIVLNTQGAPGNWTVWPAVNSVRRGFIKAPYKPILSVEVTSHVGETAPSVLVEGEDYEVDYVNGRIYCLGYGWSMKAEAYTVTAKVGVDNGTEDLTVIPPVLYDSTIAADESHGMSGDIHQIAIIVAATFSGFWMKKIITQGNMQPQSFLVTHVDKDILQELYRWAAKA
jgi:hypothetical protein